MPNDVQFVDRLPDFERLLGERLRRAAADVALLLESYAKTHHDWVRRTGFTDASTMGTWAEAGQAGVDIVLSAGMDYDVYLELHDDGRWAWLRPAIEANAESMHAIVQRWLGV